MKPPCMLVYTGGDAPTYNRIHDALVSLLPKAVYTIFNISLDAMRKPHWIEPSSACLILTDTRDLDDVAWKQVHEYFNKSGKIIFVCQNSLLTSFSAWDSIKEQDHLLSFVFGEKSTASMSDDLETFRIETLKALGETGEVHERYHPKELIGGHKYSVVMSKQQDSPLILCMECESAHLHLQCASTVLSDATTDQLLAPGSRIFADALTRVGVKTEEGVKVPSLSIGYFIVDDDFLAKCKSLRYGAQIFTSKPPHLFMNRGDSSTDNPLPAASPDLLPIQVVTRDEADSCCSFGSNKYFSMLDTITIGKRVLYVPVTTSTIDACSRLCEALPGEEGLCVIASEQVKGRGRGGNEFISVAGTAMFNFTYWLPASAALTKHPIYIQYIAVVATTAAVHELSGIEDFPLRVKWPNDFYFNRSQKIGGLLVNGSTRGEGMELSVGIGLNVSNALPTTCLNSMMPEKVAKFCIEEVIAKTMNKFEYLVNIYENKGQAAFLEHYYKYWLHTGEEVTLENGNEKVIIVGLNKHGYLECKSKKNPSQVFSVSDDGNTFDMLNGLIRMKIT